MARILVVDDDVDILILIKNALQLQGYLVDVFNRAQAVDKSQLGQYAAILLDIMMPEMDGLTFCQEIRPLVDCPIIFWELYTSLHQPQ